MGPSILAAHEIHADFLQDPVRPHIVLSAERDDQRQSKRSKPELKASARALRGQAGALIAWEKTVADLDQIAVIDTAQATLAHEFARYPVMHRE